MPDENQVDPGQGGGGVSQEFTDWMNNQSWPGDTSNAPSGTAPTSGVSQDFTDWMNAQNWSQAGGGGNEYRAPSTPPTQPADYSASAEDYGIRHPGYTAPAEPVATPVERPKPMFNLGDILNKGGELASRGWDWLQNQLPGAEQPGPLYGTGLPSSEQAQQAIGEALGAGQKAVEQIPGVQQLGDIIQAATNVLPYPIGYVQQQQQMYPETTRYGEAVQTGFAGYTPQERARLEANMQREQQAKPQSIEQSLEMLKNAPAVYEQQTHPIAKIAVSFFEPAFWLGGEVVGAVKAARVAKEATTTAEAMRAVGQGAQAERLLNDIKVLNKAGREREAAGQVFAHQIGVLKETKTADQLIADTQGIINARKLTDLTPASLMDRWLIEAQTALDAMMARIVNPKEVEATTTAGAHTVLFERYSGELARDLGVLASDATKAGLVAKYGDIIGARAGVKLQALTRGLDEEARTFFATGIFEPSGRAKAFDTLAAQARQTLKIPEVTGIGRVQDKIASTMRSVAAYPFFGWNPAYPAQNFYNNMLDTIIKGHANPLQDWRKLDATLNDFYGAVTPAASRGIGQAEQAIGTRGLTREQRVGISQANLPQARLPREPFIQKTAIFQKAAQKEEEIFSKINFKEGADRMYHTIWREGMHIPPIQGLTPEQTKLVYRVVEKYGPGQYGKLVDELSRLFPESPGAAQARAANLFPVLPRHSPPMADLAAMDKGVADAVRNAANKSNLNSAVSELERIKRKISAEVQRALSHETAPMRKATDDVLAKNGIALPKATVQESLAEQMLSRSGTPPEMLNQEMARLGGAPRVIQRHALIQQLKANGKTGAEIGDALKAFDARISPSYENVIRFASESGLPTATKGGRYGEGKFLQFLNEYAPPNSTLFKSLNEVKARSDEAMRILTEHQADIRSFKRGATIAERTAAKAAPQAMTFDEFSISRGVGATPPSRPELHRAPGGVSEASHKAASKRLEGELGDWQSQRDALRDEYKQLIESGKLRMPSRTEKLTEISKGEGEQASAAQRLLAKQAERAAPSATQSELEQLSSRMWDTTLPKAERDAAKKRLGELRNVGYLPEDVVGAHPIIRNSQVADMRARQMTAEIDRLAEWLKAHWNDPAPASAGGGNARDTVMNWVGSNEFKQAHQEAGMLSQQAGTAWRNFVLHDYIGGRYNADAIASRYILFHFWMTREGQTYLEFLLRNPQFVNAYNAYSRELEKINTGLPESYREQIPIDFPFGRKYFNVQASLNPLNRHMNFIQSLLGGKENPLESAFQFTRPLPGAEGVIRRGAGALGFKQMEGLPEQTGRIGAQIPQTPFIQSLTAYLKEKNPNANWAQMIPAGGLNIENIPHAALNAAMQKMGFKDFNLSAENPYDPTRVGRQIVQMRDNKEITDAQANQAMLEQRGDVWDKAFTRAYSIRAGSDVPGFLGALRFTTMLPSEQEIEAAKAAYAPIKEARKAGQDISAETKAFAEKYPWYFSYSERYSPAEVRAGSEVKDAFYRLSAVDQRLFANQAGNDFKKFIYAKGERSERSEQSIAPTKEQFAVWLAKLGAQGPAQVPAAPVYAIPAYVAAKPEWKAAYEERDAKVKELGGWDAIILLESTYFSYPERSQQRRDYIAQNPNLKTWFDYSREWNVKNADLAKALGLGAVAPQAAGTPSYGTYQSARGGYGGGEPRHIDYSARGAPSSVQPMTIKPYATGDFSLDLQSALDAYFYRLTPLTADQRKALMAVYLKLGAGLTFDAWLEGLRPKQTSIPRLPSYGGGSSRRAGHLRSRTVAI